MFMYTSSRRKSNRNSKAKIGGIPLQIFGTSPV